MEALSTTGLELPGQRGKIKNLYIILAGSDVLSKNSGAYMT